MAESRVGKGDHMTVVVAKANGDKIVVRGQSIKDGSATLHAGERLEVRREDGTLLVSVKDEPMKAITRYLESILYEPHPEEPRLSLDMLAHGIAGALDKPR